MKPILSLMAVTLSAFIATTLHAEEDALQRTQSTQSLKSREQVRAELASARAADEIPHGDAPFVAVDRSAAASELTRTQVRAEAVEARRLGLIPAGDAPMKVASESELELVRLAGLLAIDTRVQTARK